MLKVSFVIAGILVGHTLGIGGAIASHEVNSNTAQIFGIDDPMCGPKCLWQVARSFGKHYSLGAVANLSGIDHKKGVTIRGLLNGAKAMGLQAQAVRTNLENLANESRVAILLLGKNVDAGKVGHFVVLDKIDKGSVSLIDGSHIRTLPSEKFATVWSGYAVLMGRRVKGKMEPFRGNILIGSGVALVAISLSTILIKKISGKNRK